MKRLSIGAMTAVLAVALVLPVCATAQTTPAPSPPMAGKKTGGPTRHSHATHNASGMSEAERLNADELTQLRMGSPAAVSTAPGGNNPTSGAAGPFAPK